MVFLAGAAAALANPPAEKRVALVIGNGAYTGIAALTNPANDARAVATKLRALGFDTVEAIDANDTAMKKAIREFASRLDEADVGLFYYAGHGIQLDNVNYLLAVNAEIAEEDDVNYGAAAIRVDDFLKPMDDKANIKVVILDACRNNPFVAELQRSMGKRSVAVGRGLARLDPGINRLIAYSTEPGNTASDGSGDNSPFTKALLKHIDAPGISFGDMMSEVTADVASATNNAQIPSVVQSLRQRFQMRPAAEVQVAVAAPQAVAPGDQSTVAPGTVYSQPVPAAPTGPDLAGEDALWEMVQDSDDPSDLQYYLDLHPYGRYVGAARFRLGKLKAKAEPSAAVAAEPAPPAPVAQPVTAAPMVGPAPVGQSPMVQTAPLQQPNPYGQPPVAGAAVMAAVNPGYAAAQPGAPAQRSLFDLSQPGDPTTEAAFTREIRREIQGRLTSLGFSTGGVDGAFGNRTRDAILSWQVSASAAPTRYLTQQQLVALRVMSEERYSVWLAEQQQRAAAARTQSRLQKKQNSGNDAFSGALLGGAIGGFVGSVIGRH
ncbi:caspase family protein [Chthonobacter rhizosphaerae]|uniref:caspase family protein n=1 Tax=Chthonobacter rhizosphaerae TaxID=2735553 RepID=UPI0015EFB1A2|nr:caspase family protein [Chthonobacter rhizosphaerae]